MDHSPRVNISFQVESEAPRYDHYGLEQGVSGLGICALCSYLFQKHGMEHPEPEHSLNSRSWHLTVAAERPIVGVSRRESPGR